MTLPDRPPVANTPQDEAQDAQQPAVPCILVFNALDPSGAGGLTADAVVVASVGGHGLCASTGCWVRDSSHIHDFHPLDDEVVEDQARAVLEDIPVQAIKVGFAGTAENLGTIAEICSDYPDIPVVTYMPDLSWWDDVHIEPYLDACSQLLLPVTSVLCGNYSTLRRWLLPDWGSDRAPSSRDIARAASEHGVPYVVVTGIQQLEQHLDNQLASAQTVLCEQRYERFDARFGGAGDTLSTALTALIAHGTDLPSAMKEALDYLDQALHDGFRPGMGHIFPDRMFWANGEDNSEPEPDELPSQRLQ